MSSQSLQEFLRRCEQDRRLLETLAHEHNWLTVEANPPAADETPTGSCRLTIEGRGLASGGPAPDQYEVGQRHELEWLPGEDYPVTAPQVRVHTPVFHPNISPDGVVSMTDIGIKWQPRLTVDVVIERIWDLIRCASFDLENAIHPAAARWYAIQSGTTFPLDEHTLSHDRPLSNIVQYRHKRRRRKQRPTELADSSVMIIEDRARGQDGSDAIHFIE